jgi:hypothetical protein
MKTLIKSIAFLWLFLVSLNVSAQKTPTQPTRDYPINDPVAFKKMMINLFNYTIVGDQAPASGFKFQTADPSATLSGNVYISKQKGFITTLSLTGGLNDNLNEVFSGNKLNGYFKSTIGLSWLLTNNAAGVDPMLNQTFLNILHEQNKDSVDAIQSSADTAVVYISLMDTLMLKTPTFVNLKQVITSNLSKQTYQIKTLTDARILSILNKLFSNLANLSGYSTDKQIAEFLNKNNYKLAKAEYDKFVINYNRLTPIFNNLQDSTINMQLKKFSKYYTYKSIYWLNLQPDLGNSSYHVFNAADSTLNASNNFLYGLKFSLNYLRKYSTSKKFRYLSAGVNLRKTNNLEELTKYTYKSSTQIKLKDGQSISKEETGTGYSGTVKSGVQYGLFAEWYQIPFEAINLGYYFKAEFNHGSPWVSPNKLSTDLGLVFNVTSSDKEAKNLLTVIPYASFSNILRQRDVTNPSKNTPLHDLFSVGFKVGIPINIGK